MSQENKRKILVVDDEPDNASVFTMGLEDISFIRKPIRVDDLVKKVNEVI